ncbi:MAG TPA: hypothetical protein VN963_06040, partial [bacterium]|nr:hypothetical protein [bacterium]
TIGTAYWVARQYWRQWFSFLFTCLLGFLFFNWTLSRMISSPALTLLFLCTAFGFLGKIKTESNSTKRIFWVFALILCCTLGFYAFTSWAVCWLLIGLCLFEFTPGTLWQKTKMVSIFCGLTLAGALPLIFARLAPGGLTHIQNTLTHFSPVQSYGAYMAGIFWNGLPSFPFGPVWGGYLNPFYDSLFFLGTVEIFKRKGLKVLIWTSIFLFLFITPGGISGDLELHRILPALVLFSLIGAWGLQNILGDVTYIKIIGTSALIIFSICFDFFHFAYRYSDPSFSPPGQQWRSVEYFNAYQTLKQLAEKTGPLDVFTEWNPDYDDKTLSVAVYPFNALDNFKLSQNRVLWISFLIDMDYTLFLKKHFPHVESHLLNPNLAPNDLHHSLGLFLIPYSDISPSVLNQWIKVHRNCKQIAFSIKNRNPHDPWSVYEKMFANLATQQTDDRFLTSILWERAASFPLMDGNFSSTAFDFQQAIQNGYPVPHLQQNFKLAAFLSHSPAQSAQKLQ